MSKKYNFIINALILILIVILVCVMMNYYAKGSSSIPTGQEPLSSSGETETGKEPKIEITPSILSRRGKK